MTDEELRRLARAHGVATAYEDWRGLRVDVPRATLVKVIEALDAGKDGMSGAARPPGAPRPARRAASRPGTDATVRAAVPERPRVWGFMAQLYSVRSRRSWGLGDLHDLADLAVWSARDLGAGFLLINPLHAGEPVPPIRPSPYLPASRRFASPLYLRVEDVPGYEALPGADRERIQVLAGPLRARNLTLDLLDRDSVWEVKRDALQLIRARTAPPDAYERFVRREGEALTGFATWCALAEVHGCDWRAWPPGLRDPRGPGVAAERRRLAERVDFHAWLQWLVAEQLAVAQRAAREAGMPIGIVHDLAVGVDPGGADAWLYQDVLASGVTVGAPPDAFNQRGQNWGQPPWHPARLAAASYRPYRGLVAASLRDSGGLRVDHVIGLFRQWWVPVGASAAEGTYVRCDHEAMVGVLVEESARTGATVIGEDLGVVEPWVHEYLPSRGVFGTSMLWFERDRDGLPLPPERWRESCLATVGTHDLPPITGYLHGDHVALRESLGLLARPAAEERADHARQRAVWRETLAALGLLDPAAPDDLQMTIAMHAFLARTPARLIGISLADAVGERRTQNQPGTVDEYPNWRVPLAGAGGDPVLIEDLPAEPRVRAVVAPVR